MTSYIVTFDLKQTSADAYSPFSEMLISKLRGHWVEGTTWLVDVRQRAPELKEYLSRRLNSDETVYVAALTRDHEFCRRMGPTREWIDKHPPFPAIASR